MIDLTKSYSIDHRKEAMWVLVNAITTSDVVIIKQIAEFDDGAIIKVLISGLNFNENRLTMNVLEALENLFKLDRTFGWVQTEKSIAFLFE